MHISKKFALQLNESIDISGHSQLLDSVCFVDGEARREKSAGDEIFWTMSEYLEKRMLTWENCSGVCTDGATATVGCTKGFVRRVKERNPDVMVTQCFVHREALPCSRF